ncbi:putative ribose-5-phosphate isomerase 2 [Wolffia australiana]
MRSWRRRVASSPPLLRLLLPHRKTRLLPHYLTLTLTLNSRERAPENPKSLEREREREMRVCSTQMKQAAGGANKPLSMAKSPGSEPTQEELKKRAAHRAVEQVRSGMVLGLGTGSTAAHALDRIGELLRSGQLQNIVGIPTSKKTEAHAAMAGIPLSDLAAHPTVDLSIDGADEVDPRLNLVKGRGGSLLREKMIEGASKKFVVIVDESKMVERIGGSGMAVPVEVVQFGWSLTMNRLKKLFEQGKGCVGELRKGEDGSPFVTDNGNFVVDLFFEEGISRDLNEVSDEILRITGVAEHGIFIGMATSVVVAGSDGIVVLERDEC